MGLHRGLSSATFPDEFARDRSARSDDNETRIEAAHGFDLRYFHRIPPSETFAFSLTTLLNDIAAHRPEVNNSQKKGITRFFFTGV